MKDRRSIAHPNAGFRAQLRQWAARHGLMDADGADDADGIATSAVSRFGLSSHLPKPPGSGLLQRGLARKMVSDSVGRLAGHGGSETDILQVARVKALGPDWAGSSLSHLTSRFLHLENSTPPHSTT
jgi:hypothetical protein